MFASMRVLRLSILFLALPALSTKAADAPPDGDPGRGKSLFGQTCALCHADSLSPAKTVLIQQGPSLVGVLGRPAGSLPNFAYTKALKGSGLTWDADTLNRFLAGPGKAVPGTTMPIDTPNAQERRDVIAYLSTLKLPANGSQTAGTASASAPPPKSDPGDWHHAAPGLKHHITLADLPPPFASPSAGNGPQVVAQPENARLAVPSGFRVRLFATGFSNPRIIRVAPNGDIFIAETATGRIRVLRAADGADTPSTNQIYAAGLRSTLRNRFLSAGT